MVSRRVGTKACSTGEAYSSSISRILNSLSAKLKSVQGVQGVQGVHGVHRVESEENRDCRTLGQCIESEDRVREEVLSIYRQLEDVVSKMRFGKMLGRDLSHCMSILSKIPHFGKDPFWMYCSNRLIKGYMLHRINAHSYYVIANSLSKVGVLQCPSSRRGVIEGMVEKESYMKTSAICTSREVGTFLPVRFDGNVLVERRISKDVHKIYDEVALRFLYTMEEMDLDGISCILNLYSRLNLREYNLLGYMFADVFFLSILRREIPVEFTRAGTEAMEKRVYTSHHKNEKRNFIIVKNENICKLVIILNCLANMDVIHVEFFTHCFSLVEKYFVYLKSIDICSIIYSLYKWNNFPEHNKRKRFNFMNRLVSKPFESYVNNVIKWTSMHGNFYQKRNHISSLELWYQCYVKNYISLSSTSNHNIYKEEDIRYIPNRLISKLIILVQKKNVLNDFSPSQISSLALSLAKLKLNSLNVFYSFCWRVHYIWKYFSLRNIADFLHAMCEKNLHEEKVTLLLYYQFVRVLHLKYIKFLNMFIKNGTFLNGKIDCIKQDEEGIYHFESFQERVHFLNVSDCALVVRIFQSFCKGDSNMCIPTIRDRHKQEDAFPYDIGKVLQLFITNSSQCTTHSRTFHNWGIPSHEEGKDKDNDYKKHRDNFWEELNSYPDLSHSVFTTIERNATLISIHVLRAFCLSLSQHFDLIPFESKCQLCYFSTNVPLLVSPLIRIANMSSYKSPSYHKVHVPEIGGWWLCKKVVANFVAKFVLHIVSDMKPQSLGEITLRQILTCIFCLHLNIIEINWAEKGIICDNEGKMFFQRRKKWQKERWGDLSKEHITETVHLHRDKWNSINEENRERNNTNVIYFDSMVKNGFILHLFSLSILKKIKELLVISEERSYQQNEATLTSSKSHTHKHGLTLVLHILMRTFFLCSILDTEFV
ncbi:conserved Plasmodium protein, unknown function [Plasmodium ovale wallikeri]|uniref:Uncharacterized protein n=1 Tax=Plasmodium ovale wallikeri TaxID=864142 RepID=A0A1A8YMM8_PLAOA|nr:conserved Plasmodium protein, unknown function [Plasmodium ovale wallikeri]SBT33151.1 conserved Plasmodium protein, unknown function [Plasmodium ovale wallikeri]